MHELVGEGIFGAVSAWHSEIVRQAWARLHGPASPVEVDHWDQRFLEAWVGGSDLVGRHEILATGHARIQQLESACSQGGTPDTLVATREMEFCAIKQREPMWSLAEEVGDVVGQQRARSVRRAVHSLCGHLVFALVHGHGAPGMHLAALRSRLDHLRAAKNR